MDCSWEVIMQCFDPIALTVGSFQIHWYAVCFLLAWVGALLGTLYFEHHSQEERVMSTALWQDLFWWLLVGGVVGARVGFALFYEPAFFWQYPEKLFLPYDFMTDTLVPLRGMSFHGGLIGVGVVLTWWSHHKQIDLWTLADRLALVAPIASLFGRLGNFLNQELPGRVTESSVGVYFPGEQVLRYPATLYSLFAEGLFLFFWMRFWYKRRLRAGTLTILYLVSYSVMRFVLEFFREPDLGVALLWDTFSRGQVLSTLMIFSALVGWFFRFKHGMIRST